MPIKLAIFDLDGTLCDTIEDLANAVNISLSTLGYPTHTVQAYKYMVGSGIPNLIYRALPEDKKSDAEVEKAKAIMLDYYKDHFADKTYAYSGIPELLQKLKNNGIHIAVCTNKAHDMAVKVIEKIFGSTFSLVIGKSDGRPLKPDPFSVNEIMQHFGVSNTETVFIGDSGVDIKTALNSQTTPIGVLWGFREKQELKENGAEHFAAAPNDIFAIINKL
ncbi:MAG: HAD family hydrolase [Clostridia bacterium]|nr:HAD family hydrolase [Clostridia bacterium]